MGDPFGRWSSTPARGEYDSSPLRQSNSFVRPTGKSIYNQRKDYGQTLLKLQSDFQHHVEHLVTMRLERELRSAEDCLGRLKGLEEQGRIWGQDVILEVKDQQLVLSDVESKEELEAFPLGSVQGCTAGLDNTVLAVSVQEWNPPGSSVLLFQCERLGAETLRSGLEKMLKQRKDDQRNPYRHSPEVPPPPAYAAPERWTEPPEPDYQRGMLPQRMLPPQRVLPPQPVLPPKRVLPPQRGQLSSDYDAPDRPQMPQTKPPRQVMSEVDRDAEVLNHVLGDLELFMAQLKMTLNSVSKRKKQKKNSALPSKDEYTDFFQKVKYALNLMGRTQRHLQNPDPAELLRLIFSALSFVLAHCPSPGLAPAVEAPLLLPEALEFLEATLGDDDYGTWKSLGTAWNKSRAEYPNSAQVPAYTPVFSDGWLPPVMEQERHGGLQDTPAPASVSPPRSRHPSLSVPPARSSGTGWRDNPRQESPLPTQGLARALYDFQARNVQELSVRKGDTLQVLDQQRKWWLVQDERGDRGHVPGNILEPLPEPGHSATQDSPPTLHPSSSPAEVTAWLMDKGFSRITVRTLGALRGQELLQMSPADLRGVCPEEWRKVLFKLSPIRTSLGIGPRD